MDKKLDNVRNSFSAVSAERPVLLRRRRKAGKEKLVGVLEPAKTSREHAAEGRTNTLDLPIENPPVIQPLKIVSSRKEEALGRKIRRINSKSTRCSSTPRQHSNNVSSEKYDFLRVARRSLSSPRHQGESSESEPSSFLPENDLQKTENICLDYQMHSSSQFKNNLKRFEEERRKCDQERSRHERRKRDLTGKQCTFFKSNNQESQLWQQNNLTKFYSSKTDKHTLTPNLNANKILLAKYFQSQEPLNSHKNSCFNNDTEIAAPELSFPVEYPYYESSTATPSESEVNITDTAETDTKNDDFCKNFLDFNHLSGQKELPNRCLNNHSCVLSPMSTGQASSDNIRFWQKHFLARVLALLTFQEINRQNLEVSPNIFKLFFQLVLIDSRNEWINLRNAYPELCVCMRLQRIKCMSQFILLIIICGFGAILFRFLEGELENSYKCGLGKVKREFIDHLWTLSHNFREEDWKTEARLKLRKFEDELHAAHEIGITSYSGMKSWSFLNSFLYCWTIVTTIGYGHIIPTTVVGRAVTIVYAIIGIPMFLILLADFGKLFTRVIKFLWVFVRRMYYTGTFRKIRKHHNVQQMVHGMNIVYEIAMRRPTLGNIDGDKADTILSKDPGTPLSHYQIQASDVDTPTSPVPETFLIDDEFNLPISVAIIILLLYMFIGAAIYCIWEEWTYFESIYFVFISMSTIGFGDFVPQHPIFMMCSIAYLIFGLALTSMCINVVQVKLSDSFKQASVKIGATIGFEMSDEEAMSTQNETPIESFSVPTSPKLDKHHPVISCPVISCPNDSNESPPPLPRRIPSKTARVEKNKKKTTENEK